MRQLNFMVRWSTHRECPLGTRGNTLVTEKGVTVLCDPAAGSALYMRPCEELVRRVLRIRQVPEDPRVSGSSGRYSDPSHPAGNLVPCANQIHFQEGFGRPPSSRKICGQYCNFGVVILSRTLAQGAPFSHWGHSVIFQSDAQGLKGMWHTVGCVRRSKEK